MGAKRPEVISYDFFPMDAEAVLRDMGEETAREALWAALLIRHFEARAEAAYQQGHVGGFFHSYAGQEAIQVGAILGMGKKHWWSTSYRCHALALLLGATPNELMAELYGRATGNAKGRGGSMHLYAERLLGGFGIVTGQVPIATGAAFTIQYNNIPDEISICFLGDGAVPQGSFHESLNIASLWDLPCVYVIENNQWGMGTAFQRANSVDRLATEKAPGYAMKGYTLNGMDFLSCYAGFKAVLREVLETRRPVLVEAVTQRFRGHSISDPGLYRSKDSLKKLMEGDPIPLFRQLLLDKGIITSELYAAKDKEIKETVIAATRFAEESPFPSIATLEDDVFAPNDR